MYITTREKMSLLDLNNRNIFIFLTGIIKRNNSASDTYA